MRRSVLASLAAAALALSPGIATAQDAPAPIVPAAAGEHEPMTEAGRERLLELIDGRVAGEPRICVDTFRNANLEIVEGAAVILRRGDRLWVNVPHDPAVLRSNQAIIFRKFGNATRTCRTDQAQLVDRFTNFFEGVLILNDFVPFDRPAD